MADTVIDVLKKRSSITGVAETAVDVLKVVDDVTSPSSPSSSSTTTTTTVRKSVHVKSIVSSIERRNSKVPESDVSTR